MANRFMLNNYERHFRNVLQYVPAMLGNDAVNFFLDNFKRQAWQGASVEPWRRRKSNAKRNSGRNVLIDTGRLRRSVRVTNISGGVVRVGSDAPYAKAHNEGFKGTVSVRAHTRNKLGKFRVNTGKFTKNGKERMRTVHRVTGIGNVKAHTRKVNIPRRQFMGNSPYLTKILQRRLHAELLKGLRKT